MTTRTWSDWSCTVRAVVAGGPAVADGAAGIVRDLMADVDRAVSRFRADSELEHVNDVAPRLVPVRPLTLTLVAVALDAARHTDGAVDPTVGHHLVRWGYDADIDSVGGGDVLPAGARADWQRVVVDLDLGRVGVPRGLRLDLGATAKAWTADTAARRIAARYRCPALVEIGGDVAAAGTPDEPWSVWVAETAGGPGEIVGLAHGGLATSSTTVRRWRTAAGAAHHVIDPRTGAPARGAIRTATVWAPSCVEANTLSTAALVWGASTAARFEPAGVTARLVDDSGSARYLGAWPAKERAA
ncbi:FAD:protein FMN transferase [Nocardioides sp. MAH-18]|uniref:FAD:protein FMN transferase n=1 Tax=Nocardioides agri TaxID=2682843 RepID=A0A6L6XW03_9ACTN|nr:MULTISPECIES: FAD:protein FMN transferase [unclassified Nocardioides]MBA2956146.1 FAD:protein FMN transferase [Nocardioides sp. CGMCC 1.13656]MVQ50992.1 FAD:protein FMN transferase [Nocardioides sp. MAH-18]